MGSCTNCLRITLIAFNTIFLLSGIALIGASAYIFATSADITTIATDGGIYVTGTALVMAAGILTFIASIFGCIGAMKRNSCMLITYFIFLLIIFAMELGGGIYAATNSPAIINAITNSFRSDISSKYGVGNNGPLTTAINHIQQQFKCCGAQTYTDYTGSEWGKQSNATIANPVPDSCCRTVTLNCGLNRTDNTNIYTNSCRVQLTNAVAENIRIVLGVGVTIGIIQVFGMIAAIMMVCDIKKEGEVV
ncbi:CD151 antigen [Trichoplax sp. H2]|uniref:Tetraspanin n=1 Tax=Trichoplax adhaerens TaxID=10228 RepID=B3RLW7_TRIAD|nr:expressed hypothetical protein [Trichoplax adhaerens]EDV29597.1 expressed hypothetical protein [Trichoplax adhaerens]RDD46566.1 CD151 antigen [Trichoplax sp. H2]|eukprot:XP_002108799.1 expressed hypothetical protein [Trichoplax adhaerens]